METALANLPYIKRLVRQFHRTTQDHDDILQNVFLNLCRRAKFRGESSYKSWIYRVVANTVHEFNRGEQKRYKLIEKFSQEPRDAEYSGFVEETFQAKEKIRKIFCGNSLREKDKRVLYSAIKKYPMKKDDVYRRFIQLRYHMRHNFNLN